MQLPGVENRRYHTYIPLILSLFASCSLCTSWEKVRRDCLFFLEAQIEAAVNECTTGDDESDEHLMFQIIQAFDFPRFFYNSERKKFVTAEEMKKAPPQLFDNACEKSELFVTRYEVIKQRVLRHKLFVKTDFVGSEEAKMKLHCVEYLLTLKTTLSQVVTLGMVVQLQAGFPRNYVL